MRRAPSVALLLVAVLLPGTNVLASHTQTEGDRSIAFAHKGGNEWWVEVRLEGAAAGAVAGVEAMDTGGAWKALAKKSWGPWAGSFRIEPGHEVRFRATFHDGARVESCWFSHPGGAERCPAPPPSGGLAASYRPSGNEWWVQVRVDAAAPLASVEARIDGGAWRMLEKKGWGDWARSLHAPEGSLVEFRARATDGRTNGSAAYRWPDATSVGDGPAPGLEATFRPKSGNAWWVETRVEANRPLARVEARVEGGAWHLLSQRSWGAWAASFHVPDGSLVRFRATGTGGERDESGLYRWPDALPVPDGAWPREGSYVRYLLEAGESAGGWSSSTMLWANLTYRSGAWGGACEGWRTEGYDGNDSRARVTGLASVPPARGPRAVEIGERVSVELPGCPEGSGRPGSTEGYVQERRGSTESHDGRRPMKEGQPVDVPSWRATYEDDSCPCVSRSIAWHPDTGLTVDSLIQMRHSYRAGHLVDTDAPIAREDTREPSKAAWPTEGSFASYRVNRTSESSAEADVREVRFTYTRGAWQATCTGREGTVDAAPPRAPSATQAGKAVRPSEVQACGITPPAVEVRGTFPHDTTRNGAHHRANAWWGDEFDASNGDEDAWWDVATGLLLAWEDHGGYFRGDEGRLTDTDAPLSSR